MKKLLFLFIIFILCGCSWNENNKIRIGVDDYATSQLLMEAKKIGYLDDNFEIIKFSNRGDSVESFYTGGIDVVYSTIFNSVYYHDKGEPGKIYMITDSIKIRDGLIVKKGMKNLKGKRIGVELNTHEYYNLKKYLNDEGLDIKDVTVVSGSMKDIINKFLKGEIDGFFSHLQYIDRLKNINGELYKNLYSQNEITEVMVVNDKVGKNRKKLKILSEAWYKILETIRENPEYLEDSNLDHEEISKEQLVRGIRFYSKSENKNFLVHGKINLLLADSSRAMGRDINIEEIYTGVVFDEKKKFYIF
ncbi:ABC transporter substrate-binding protein [uncultured Ilyobacter sp.]|uniref:ABC transporter substrate-binding protein n=1 Tax=uncultured Ilyobacter sp. TaxID=544433 RepID=UPI002AA8D08F|nr:ABC transporter substrate-binding protein [uncultured Ilyobacter sp.]